MSLPVRIWLRFQLCTALHQKRNVGIVSAIVSAFRKFFAMLFGHNKNTQKATGRSSGQLIAGLIASQYNSTCKIAIEHQQKAKSNPQGQRNHKKSQKGKSKKGAKKGKRSNAQPRASWKSKSQRKGVKPCAQPIQKCEREKSPVPMTSEPGSEPASSLSSDSCESDPDSTTAEEPFFLAAPATPRCTTAYLTKDPQILGSEESSIDLETHPRHSMLVSSPKRQKEANGPRVQMVLYLRREHMRRLRKVRLRRILHRVRRKRRVCLHKTKKQSTRQISDPKPMVLPERSSPVVYTDTHNSSDRDMSTPEAIVQAIPSDSHSKPVSLELSEASSTSINLMGRGDDDSAEGVASLTDARSFQGPAPPNDGEAQDTELMRVDEREFEGLRRSLTTSLRLSNSASEESTHQNYLTQAQDPQYWADSVTFETTVGLHVIPVSQAIPQQTEQYQKLTKPTDGSFFIDLMYNPLFCQMDECEKPCNLYDGSTVICPCCGPYSKTRYCCDKHLQLSWRNHWDMQKGSFAYFCVPDSIPQSVHESPPLLINLHGWDTPQRHRQAVWFNTAQKVGDYFLFDDRCAIPPGPNRDGSNLELSSTPKITISFNDPEEKDRFRRCLAICLFASVTNAAVVNFTFRLLRDKMRSMAKWGLYNSILLRKQFLGETSLEMPEHVVGYRHACETEWNGWNPNECFDFTCSKERVQPLLGDVSTRAFIGLTCERMENCYWILRVNRTTHPKVEKALDRMQGKGWDEVLLHHQRIFRRGEGWDGADSGPMEIEGVNC